MDSFKGPWNALAEALVEAKEAAIATAAAAADTATIHSLHPRVRSWRLQFQALLDNAESLEEEERTVERLMQRMSQIKYVAEGMLAVEKKEGWVNEQEEVEMERRRRRRRSRLSVSL